MSNKYNGIGSEVVLSQRYYEDRIVSIIGETPHYWKTRSGLFSKEGLTKRGDYYTTIRFVDEKTLTELKLKIHRKVVREKLRKTDWNKVSDEDVSRIFCILCGQYEELIK